MFTQTPEGLPWTSLAYLTEGGAYEDATFGAAYFTECLVLGIKVSEECKVGTGGTSYEILNVGSGVEAKGETLPESNCTVGGTEAGIIEFDGENSLTLNSGAALSVSSE